MSLHSKLKEATSDQHQATEQLLFPQKSWSDFSLADYHEFLRIQYVFHQQMEQQIDTALSPHLKQTLNWPSRRKLRWLESDLQKFGSKTPSTFPESENIASDAEAMGLLYVTEGSMLGGRMIEKTLRKNRQLESHSPFRFLEGYGSDTACYWKEFLKTLEDGNFDTQTVIATAQWGFDSFAKSVFFVQSEAVS